MGSFDADVAVIGSGFGGSVAALRAAQAGRRVVVAEQGRRISDDDFERGARSVRSLLWEPALGLRGYFRQTPMKDVVVVSGVGVGGGSLVYAAVLIDPPRAALQTTPWTRTGLDWPTELEPHLATAATMLGRAVNPQFGVQDLWLRQAAESMGVGDSFGPTAQGIDFDACVGCGQCITGCPYGAKHSLDRTYLARAEALGARIMPRSKVEILTPLGRGDGCDGWRLVMTDPLAGRRAKPRSITARSVVVAAGVLGTVGLLLAGRDRWRVLPALSDELGNRVRTNSEAFGAVLHPAGTDVMPGATISSDFYPDARTHVTNNRFPKSYTFMKYYLSPSVEGAHRARATLGVWLRHPLASSAALRARDWHRRTTVLTVMQHDDNELQCRLVRRGFGWRLVTTRPVGSVAAPAYLPEADAATRAVADVSGGQPFTTLMESVGRIAATAHILGGAAIGPDRGSGVVDPDLRVFGYENLRVMDGSVVPSNIGVNPSLTITALAERACASWLG
ncbi:MAG: GMC family oxidoreductase [Actinobacteria bacterium]|nr:GMC family oxidoreductase [Actinomycetota bacterium]